MRGVEREQARDNTIASQVAALRERIPAVFEAVRAQLEVNR
jgi:hypothetical protein